MPETPGTVLARLLQERGVDCVITWIPNNPARIRDLGVQEIAVEMLVYERDICLLPRPQPMRVLSTSRGVIVGVPRREGPPCRYVVWGRRCYRKAVSWRELEALLPNPPLPLFIVDLGMLGRHNEEEKGSLKVQLGVALSVVRRYLWDPHLALTSAGDNVREWLSDVIGRAKITVSQEKPGRVLWSMGADRVIILRPDAEEPLTEDDIRGADAFVLGGVVDKIPRKGASRYLDASVPWGEPRRIELRGSIIGVPDRINRVIEIILRVLFEGLSVEEAVIASMTKRDLIRRLVIEIMRASRGGRKRLGRDHYEYLRSWLPVSCEDYVLAARKARVALGWDCEGADTS